jgi:hypothetical protein
MTSDSSCVACQDWYQPQAFGDCETQKCRIPTPAERAHYAHSPLQHYRSPLDLYGVDVPANPDSYPSSKQSKTTRRSATAPFTKQMQMFTSARAMDRTILKVTMIPHPGFGCVLTFQSKPRPTQSIYQLTVNSLPKCNCPAFKDMFSKFGQKRNSFLHCKHLYFIFVKVYNADPEVDLFIHASLFSFNEVKFILEGGLLTHSTSSQSSTTLGYDICVNLWTSCKAIID